MKPEDVPAEWGSAAISALQASQFPGLLPGTYLRPLVNIALAAVIPLIEAREREACALDAGLSAWKHEGNDAYSRGLDAGAAQQVAACVAAIRARGERT